MTPPDAWQQRDAFAAELAAPPARAALPPLRAALRAAFHARALYAPASGTLAVPLPAATALLADLALVPPLTAHDFNLALHLVVAPALAHHIQPADPPHLDFDAFVTAVAFAAFYYPPARGPAAAPGLADALAAVADRLSAPDASPPASLPFHTPRTHLPSPDPSDRSPRSASPRAHLFYTPRGGATPWRAPPRRQHHAHVPDHGECGTTPTAPDAAPVLAEVKGNPLSADTTSALPANFPDSSAVTGTPTHTTESCASPKSCANAVPEKAPASVAQSHTEHNLETRTDSQTSFTSPPLATSPHFPPTLSEKPSDTNDTPLHNRSPSLLPLDEEQRSSLRLECNQPNVNTLLPACPTQSASPVTAHTQETNATAESVAERQPSMKELPRLRSPCPESMLPAHLGDARQPPEVETSDHSTSPSDPDLTPDAAETHLSTFPSTAVSHLASPPGDFQSPELTADTAPAYELSSVEPISSRKLTFSDTDDASDDSSYEAGPPLAERLAGLDHLMNSTPVFATQMEATDNAPALASPSVTDMRSPEEDVIGESELDEELEFDRETNSISAGDHDSVTATPVPAASHVIALGGPDDRQKSPLHAPAEYEESNVVEGTPVPANGSTLVSNVLDDEDEGDHTLLYENGNESDGSELSMRTREAMSMMVEEYMSSRSFSRAPEFPKNALVEEQVLPLDDEFDQSAQADFEADSGGETTCLGEQGRTREGEVDKVSRSDAKILQKDYLSGEAETSPADVGMESPGPSASVQAENIAREVVEECVSMKNREPNMPTLMEDQVGQEENRQDDDTSMMSPTTEFSQKVSFSSELTPEGFNLIKKQMVHSPSPFVFTDSTVGSSISSQRESPNVEDASVVRTSAVNEEIEMKQQVEELAPKTVVPHVDPYRTMPEADMMTVMRETLQVCSVLREEVERGRQVCRFGRILEMGIFGLVIILITLVLVERRIQRGLFAEVMV